MPGLNKGHTGRAYPPTEPYEVNRHKIAEFAHAIGDQNPLYLNSAAAQAVGYPDVIAPPTFPIVITMLSSRAAVADPDLGLDYARVVHGEQQFIYSRPLQAGDVVTAQSTITVIREVGSLSMVQTETHISTVDGEHVCTGYATLVERGE